MSPSPLEPPDENSTTADHGAPEPQLLIDQLMKRYDLAVIHAQVFRVPPAVCCQAVQQIDLFQDRLVRALLDIRGLPQRFVGALRGRGEAAMTEASRGTFRLEDMVGLGWMILGKDPGVELVLGQVSRPWKSVATSTEAPGTPGEFSTFDQPGFAKIATSIRFDPYGSSASILTMETRVALTDEESRRRFRRYWLLVGPFSHLIRRLALRLLAGELRRSAVGSGYVGGPGW